MAYIVKAEPHPLHSDAIRVTASAALDPGTAEIAGNWSLSPAAGTPCQWARLVLGSGNTQIDLYFGTDIPSDGNTLALWRLDESQETVVTAPLSFLPGSITAAPGPSTTQVTVTYPGHGFVTNQKIY